tara:strand:- start:311 stop:724 length:414 start_codon:yes stop_codon:yes gene_type:complete
MDDKKKMKINENLNGTLASSLGLEITEVSDSFVCGKIPVDHRTKQPWGILHGGASVALAETLGSIAGNLNVNFDLEMVVGVEINANHLKRVTTGWVHGKAEPVKIGRKIQVWEIKILNDDDELVCISRLTLAVISKK